jgi:hypothetical protein
MSSADEVYWANMSVHADQVLASFNWYGASTEWEETVAVVSMAEEIAKLRDTIERVRALHRARRHAGGDCQECNDSHPCDTIRVLDGEGA